MVLPGHRHDLDSFVRTSFLGRGTLNTILLPTASRSHLIQVFASSRVDEESETHCKLAVDFSLRGLTSNYFLPFEPFPVRSHPEIRGRPTPGQVLTIFPQVLSAFPSYIWFLPSEDRLMPHGLRDTVCSLQVDSIPGRNSTFQSSRRRQHATRN